MKRRKATCFKAIKDDMIHAGARYVDEEVAVDGNLFRSRKPASFPASSRQMIAALKREGKSQIAGRA